MEKPTGSVGGLVMYWVIGWLADPDRMRYGRR